MEQDRIIGAGRQAIEAAQAGLAAAAEALGRLEGRASRSAGRLSDKASAAASDLYDEASDKAQAGYGDAREAARHYGKAGSDAARDYARQGASLIAHRAKSQPMTTVLTAAAVGFLLGWMFRS